MNALDFDKHQMVRLEINVDDSGCEYVHRPRYKNPVGNEGVQNFTTKVICHNARSFRSARERWWFISVSRCNGTEVHTTYTLFYLHKHIVVIQFIL